MIYFTFKDAPIKVDFRKTRFFSGQAKIGFIQTRTFSGWAEISFISEINPDYLAKDEWVMHAAKATDDKSGDPLPEACEGQLLKWLHEVHGEAIMKQLRDRRNHG